MPNPAPEKPALAWTCSVDGCSGSIASLSSRCCYHEAVAYARELSADEYDRLRNHLAATSPITDEQRRAGRAKSALRSLEWNARDLSRNVQRAQESGATAEQIAHAVARGGEDA